MVKRLRVLQWATGNIGTRALRAVIDHPELELAGVLVSNPDKAGRDAGALCGREDTGILATNSIADALAIPADCVLYMRQGTDFDELCQLLRSGRNVVTTRGDFHHPARLDAAARARIEQACAEGDTSIYSTGSSPGFVTEALILPLLSLTREFSCLTIDEFADISSRNSPDLLFKVMGFGSPMRAFEQARADHVKADFSASLAQVGEAMGLGIDEWRAQGEYGAARQDTEIAAGTIAAGTMAAQRITVEGVQDGVTRLRFRANWYVSKDLTVDWPLGDNGWRVRLDSDTPLDVSIGFPVAPEDYPEFTPGLTAHRAVNSVAAVCGAPAGIRTTVDLPQVVSRVIV